MTSPQQGFIALFFTLGVSSMLLAFVVMSSTSVFDFIHSRDDFMKTRASVEEVLHCVDMFTNRLIQQYSLPHIFTECTVTHQTMHRVSDDILEFSFTIKELGFIGTIVNGRITDITYSYISL